MPDSASVPARRNALTRPRTWIATTLDQEAIMRGPFIGGLLLSHDEAIDLLEYGVATWDTPPKLVLRDGQTREDVYEVIGR